MRTAILKALHKKYEGVIAEAEANIEVYLRNPAGIENTLTSLQRLMGNFK